MIGVQRLVDSNPSAKVFGTSATPIRYLDIGRNMAGKFIVFCPNVEQLQRMVNECDSWFTKVNHDIHKYTVYAQNSASDKQFEDFRNDKSDSALKLLFCIDMLNEGVHFYDVDGVIMLRSTQSANVFYQQLGRALACSDSKKKPLIFDIVNNYETGDTAQQYAGFMEIAHGEGDYDDEIEFELYDYVRDIREILSELNDTFANSWDFNFELLKEYAEKYHAFPDGNTSYEGVLIGKWANQQRALNNQGKLSKTRVDKLNSIDFTWDVNEASWQTFYEELKSIVESLGHFPKKSELGADKTNLYAWVTAQKTSTAMVRLKKTKPKSLLRWGVK